MNIQSPPPQPALYDPLSLLRLSGRRRLPVMRQSEAAECGLVCLAMVAYSFGLKMDIPTLRQRFTISTRGMDFAMLTRMARSLGLTSRAVKLELRDIVHLKTPSILHWGFHHFVVLKRVTGKGAVLHDPAIGERRVTWEELDKKFTGAAMELWPSDQFKPRDERKFTGFRDVIRVPRGFLTFVANLLAIGFCLELLGILLPIFSQWSIDHVAAAANMHLLAMVAVGMAGSRLLSTVFSLCRSWMITRATVDFSVRWRVAVFEHLVKLPLEWFQKRRIGDITSRFGATDSIVGLLNYLVVESVIDGLMSVVVLGIMLIYDLRLTLISVAGTVIYSLIRTVRAGTMRRLTRESAQSSALASSQFLETIRGIRAVKLFTREDGRKQEWLSSVVEASNTGIFLSRTKLFFSAVSAIIGGAEEILVFYLAMQMVMSHEFTLGAVIAFNAYRGQFYGRIASLVDNWMDLRMADVHAQRLSEIVMTSPEPGHSEDQLERVGELSGEIRCTGLRFRYGEFEPYVLDNVDVLIQEGESVAIVGPSGCGKSTLLALMVGLTQPTEGEVHYGGIPLRALPAGIARTHVACVMQDDLLFGGTIAQNIAAFSGDIDIDFAMQCARIAQLHDDILRMPMGYNTLVGDMGGTLSGGQRQRLCIARALYRQPKILLLDEATSHLDVATERRLNDAISDLAVTRVIIAHRPETIQSARRVIALERGRIATAS